MVLKQIVRRLLKYKTATVFSLLSLVVTFLGVIVLMQYVSFENNYDNFHKQSKTLFRLETLSYNEHVSTVFANIIKEGLPEVEDAICIDFSEEMVGIPNQDNIQNKTDASLIYSDQNFFDAFSFSVIQKAQPTFLQSANTVALTASFAQKLFASTDVLGKTVLINDQLYEVTAILDDFPLNSSIQADAVASLETFRKAGDQGVDDWSDWSHNVFLKLNEQVSPADVSKKIAQIPEIADALQIFFKEHEGMDYFYLTPMDQLHFASSRNYQTMNKTIINVLIVLAFLLAIMGLINFVNFTTSQSFQRVKSLSILQVYGAKRFNVMRQVFYESILFCLAMLFLAMLLHALSYSYLENIFQIKGLAFNVHPSNMLWYICFAIFYGIVAATYPAFYITSAKINEAIKGRPKFYGRGELFRNGLITMQFVFTISLVISAFFIEKQLNFWQSYNKGIDSEQVVFLNTTEGLKQNSEAFVNELLKNPNIVDYTYSQFAPGNVWMGWGRMVNEKRIQIKCWPVDKKFIDFFGIEIVEGRKFQTNTDADINNFIVNQKAVLAFAWENPLEYSMNGFDFEGKIIGVAKDFNFADLRSEILPMQLWLTNTRKDVLMLRVNTQNFAELFAFIKSEANKMDPQNTIEVKFLDQFVNSLYDTEVRMARLVEFVAFWCMLLALTGILGLVIFTTRHRVKEIGVRKVNGANVAELMYLLNRDYIVWVLLAFFIAAPIAYYAVSIWLQSFAYRTTLSWWVFVLAGCTALVVALLTVSWQTFKAARKNPIESLRYE